MNPGIGPMLLMLMFAVGLPGIMIAVEADNRVARRWALIWAIIWSGPPLVRLWFAALLS